LTARKNIYLLTAILAVVCLAVWINSIPVPLHFDDEQVILNNADLRQPSVFCHAEKWFSFHGRPLSNASFMLNYQLHQLNTDGYHWVNIFIHFLSALAVYKIILLILLISGKPIDKKSQLAALAGAVIFLVHPMQTESVTYISQRMTSLSGMFFFWGYFQYLTYRHGGQFRIRPLILFALFIILAFLSKQTALNIFPVIIVTELILFKSRSKQTLNIVLASAMAVLIFTAAWLMGVETRDSALLSRSDYLFSQFPVLLLYLSKMVLPLNLNVDYDVPVYHSLLSTVPILSLLALILIMAGAWTIRRYHAIISLGIFFIFASLTLESTIFPIRDLMADHRVYIGMAGLSMVFSITVYSINRRFIKYIFILIPVIGFSVLTIKRNQIWHSPVSLWKDAAMKSPAKSRPWTNLGFAYYNEEKYTEANECYEKAVELNPADYAAWNNMGILAYRQKKYFKAIRCFRKSYTANNIYLPTLNNMGKVLTDLNLHYHALFVFNHILHLYPDDNNVLFNKAFCLENLGEYIKAEETYRLILTRDPGFVSAAYNLGIINMQAHKDDEAAYYFKYITDRHPGDSDAMNNLAIIYYRNGKKQEAVQLLKSILEKDPEHKQASYNLNSILLEDN
jgi:tetratricopeptide (TPR) repeat protein